MVATTAGVRVYEGNGGHREYPSHVNLAILFNGEFDMWDLVEKGSLIDAMKAFIGGTPTEVPELYDALCSIKRVHSKVPPTLLLHGTKDRCVSHEQSRAFYNRLKQVGVDAELELYEDKPHAWFNKEPDRTETVKRMERFLIARFGLRAEGESDDGRTASRVRSGEESPDDQEGRSSHITVELAGKGGFASFTNRRHPGNRIGYRFFEHSPLVFGAAPDSRDDAGSAEASVRESERSMIAREGIVIHRHGIADQPKWVSQHWTFYMAPTQEGIDLLWVIETEEQGLPSYYGVQQCFRMSGKTNAAWRREIAETPAFSEYDFWTSQKDAARKTSLTCVPRHGQWNPLPPIETCVGVRTPLGVRIDEVRFDGTPPEVIGPYRAKMLDPADCGLITRTDRDGKWVCGIFWERTSHVTNHHPADCLHTIVNIGGIAPHSRRALKGKIYWFEGTKDKLLRRWREDFDETGTPR
jgi:hypothetical protein